MRYVSLGDAGGTSGGKLFTSIPLGGGADGARGRKPWMSIELGGGADGARGRMRCVGIKLGGGVVGGLGLGLGAPSAIKTCDLTARVSSSDESHSLAIIAAAAATRIHDMVRGRWRGVTARLGKSDI